MTEITRRVLGRSRALAALGALAETPDVAARSLYLPPGLMPHETKIPDAVAEQAVRSQTGAVFFLSPGRDCLWLPPFPIAERQETHGLAIAPLASLLRRDYLIALVLVRLGSYAVGVFHGEERQSSKVGTGLVHGRHRQGGSSAHRFERHRDKQIEYFLTRVCQHAREHLEPQARALEYLVYGSAWTTIRLLREQCPFLGRLKTPALPPLLDVPEPRQPVLEASIKRVYACTIIEWRD